MEKRIIIGRAEKAKFPVLGLSGVPVRIDTGAKTSSIWASNVREKNGRLRFTLFGENSPHFNGQSLRTKNYSQKIIASSNGAVEKRYVVKLVIELKGRTIRAAFTLANRSSQTYPILVGRNILRGKFIVDVEKGKSIGDVKKTRSKNLQSNLSEV